MSKSLYELLALCARYLFAGLMALIVIRAWRITVVDSRRAKTLRRISPETGLIGEMMVIEGDEKARRGMKYKVTREGQIGSARRADIRIRHSSVRRRHAYYLMTEEGLKVRSHAGAPLRDEAGYPVREMILRDGDNITVGRVQLMLVLTQAPEPERISRRKKRRGDEGYDETETYDTDAYGEDLFEPEPDLFGEYSQPVMERAGRRHLPFTLEEGPGIRPGFDPIDNVRRTMRLRQAGKDPFATDSILSGKGAAPGRGKSPTVEDNPLNRRRPRYGAPDANDDEMW